MSRQPSRAPPAPSSLVTPSASPPHLPRDRPDSIPPLKRRRLSTPGRSSSQDALVDVEKERGDSVGRLLETWSQLGERWGRRIDEDDVVDLLTGDVIENRGVLESMAKPSEFGPSGADIVEPEREAAEAGEDTEDELDCIVGFDVKDRPIEYALSDDNISTTDDDDGSPLQTSLLNYTSHYKRLDVNNAQDAEDLRAFLEAERKRKELYGVEDEESGTESAEDASALVQDHDPAVPEHDDALNAEDEISHWEDEHRASPITTTSRPSKSPDKPLKGKPPSSPFKVPKLPLKPKNSSSSEALQLLTPPRSSSTVSFPSQSPSPFTPRQPGQRRSAGPSKPRVTRVPSVEEDIGIPPHADQAQTPKPSRLDVKKTKLDTSHPLQVSASRSSPVKTSRLRPEVVVERPQKTSTTTREGSASKTSDQRRRNLHRNDTEPSLSPPSSPLKGKEKARPPIYVVSDSENDEPPLRKSSTRRSSPPAVSTRKRKRSSETPLAARVASQGRAKSINRDISSSDEDVHVERRYQKSAGPLKPARSRPRPASDFEDEQPRAGPSNHRPQRRHDLESFRHSSPTRRSAPSLDSDEEEHYQRPKPSRQRSQSYFDSSLPPSSDSDHRYQYPPPYPPQAADPYAQHVILEAVHRLYSYLGGPWPPPSIKGHNPALGGPYTPARSSSAFGTPSHPRSYAYDPNYSRGTLPPSSPEEFSSPIRLASSLVERSRSRGRRVSFKLEGRDGAEDVDEDASPSPYQGKGKERAIGRPTRRDDVDSSPAQRTNRRACQGVVGRSTEADDADSSSSESEPDIHAPRRGRSKARAQTPGPVLKKARDHSGGSSSSRRTQPKERKKGRE